MKKRGFTLIELLAVIVVLAIIALIATPIVLNVIKDAEESAVLRSAENYMNAVENAIASANMNESGTFKPTLWTINLDGNLNCDGLDYDLAVDISGTYPIKGSIYFENNMITNIELGYESARKYVVNGENGNLVYGYKKYKDGEIVYYDVITGENCTNYHEDNSIIGYNGIYKGENSRKTTDNQNSCLKFYSFNDDKNNSSLNLLLDHNTTAQCGWNGKHNVKSGPITVLNQLYNDTKEWLITGMLEGYNANQVEQSSGAGYQIDYNSYDDKKYNARLITAKEISQITNNTDWNQTIDSGEEFFLETNSNVESDDCKNGNNLGCRFGWLYDRTDKNCLDYGCSNNSNVDNVGYWTISPCATWGSTAWYVTHTGKLSRHYVTNSGYSTGIRPVITVKKESIF